MTVGVSSLNKFRFHFLPPRETNISRAGANTYSVTLCCYETDKITEFLMNNPRDQRDRRERKLSVILVVIRRNSSIVYNSFSTPFIQHLEIIFVLHGVPFSNWVLSRGVFVAFRSAAAASFWVVCAIVLLRTRGLLFAGRLKSYVAVPGNWTTNARIQRPPKDLGRHSLIPTTDTRQRIYPL